MNVEKVSESSDDSLVEEEQEESVDGQGKGKQM
jgi:hypothetical protein